MSALIRKAGRRLGFGLRQLGLGLRTLLRWGLDVLYPQDCFFCGGPVSGGYLCPTCRARIPFRRHASCAVCGAESLSPDGGPDFLCRDCLEHRPAFDRAFVTLRYDAAVRDLVHVFKYHRGIWLTGDLAVMMVGAYLMNVSPLGLRFDALVPVPMQRSKFRSRGYNQAALLADELGRQFGRPVKRHYLRRVKTDEVSQTHLSREGRRKNAMRAFRTAHPRHLKGKTLLLIDDVLTTGATCDACAKLLKEAGAARVFVLVLARPIRL